jgi:hypothetical protein
MDSRQFDNLIRSLAASRRALFPGMLAIATGWAGASTGEAKKHKHKHKQMPKKAKPNFFGCIDVGKACASASDCCSGICRGKKGKKLCVAHGTGTCDQAADGFCEAADPEQTTCNDNPGCVCITTTAGSKFCTDPNPASGSGCGPCRTDADCEALLFPAGSACAPVAAGNCVSSPCGGFGCFVPCGPKPPKA